MQKKSYLTDVFSLSVNYPEIRKESKTKLLLQDGVNRGLNKGFRWDL